ncbi:MAG: Mrp/NBP35 family ATP-binding protein [Acidimicrobiales bacterium]
MFADADEGEARRALGAVLDPEMRRELSELDMVESLRLRRHKAQVVLRLPVGNYPKREELTAAVSEALRSLDEIAEVSVDFVAMSPDHVAALRRALQPGAGAAGPAAAPLGHEQGRPNQFMGPGSKTRVIGVTSGKGGVGKSSVTVNVAVALSRLGHDVGILDADVYGFSVPKMIGITYPPMVVDEIMVPPVAYGLRCVSMGFFVSDEQPVIWRGPMLHKALEQFLVDMSWGRLDYLLVDMPPGTGDVALSMSQYLPRTEVFVVTTPQPAAQRVAQRSAYMAKKVNLPLRGVIENMSFFTGDDGKRYEIFGSGGGELLARELEVPLIGKVPLVTALREGGDEGVPVTISSPTSEVALAFESIAKRIETLGPARIYRSELTVH